jgi:hypothetical protein
MAEIEKAKVTVRHRGKVGGRVASDVITGSVLLNPGDAKEVEMSRAGIEHYKKKNGEIEVLEGSAAAEAVDQAADRIPKQEEPPLTTESKVKVLGRADMASRTEKEHTRASEKK